MIKCLQVASTRKDCQAMNKHENLILTGWGHPEYVAAAAVALKGMDGRADVRGVSRRRLPEFLFELASGRAMPRRRLQEKQQAYDNAVRERDTQVNNLGKENPAVAEYEARVNEAKCLAPNDIMSPSEQKDLISVARVQADNANARVAERADYKEAAYSMQKYIGINGIVQAMGSTLQTMAQQLSQIQAADATKRGAEQQRLQEQLDQTKDLFQQDQELINSVVQLMQAIVSAETQSMHDTIQA